MKKGWSPFWKIVKLHIPVFNVPKIWCRVLRKAWCWLIDESGSRAFSNSSRTSPHCKEIPKQASKCQVAINALDVTSAFILVMVCFLSFYWEPDNSSTAKLSLPTKLGKGLECHVSSPSWDESMARWVPKRAVKRFLNLPAHHRIALGEILVPGIFLDAIDAGKKWL